VLTNFVEVVRTMLYDGQSVRIQDFGCFSLSAHCEGSERKEDCGVRNIKSVHIRFRPAASLKPNLNSKHPAEQLRFYEVKAGRAARPRGGA
jgi:nucleoid DNA-binding protein